MVEVQQVTEGHAVAPPFRLQQRLAEEFHRIAKAEISHRYHVGRDAEDFPQLGNPEHPDPTHADAFGTSRRPQILHGTAG